MRIEPLCKITVQYVQASWHRPYGERPDRSVEALGFGHGGVEPPARFRQRGQTRPEPPHSA